MSQFTNLMPLPDQGRRGRKAGVAGVLTVPSNMLDNNHEMKLNQIHE